MADYKIDAAVFLAGKLSRLKASKRYGCPALKVYPALAPEDRDLIVRALSFLAQHNSQAEAAAECYDCGLSYDDPGFSDLVVPDDVWLKISPTGHSGGLLCPTCMVRRAEHAGLESIQAVFRSGPFVAR